MSLFDSTTLTFTRYLVQDVDDYGNPTSPADPSPIEAKGSLQPYKPSSDRTITVPEGFTYEDFKIFYTKTQLQAANPLTDTPADSTIHNGVSYSVHDPGDWYSDFAGSSIKHFEVILIRNEGIP